MKLFDKRNVVLLMSIFLLLLMVSSVSAADVSEDAVVGNDAAIDTITSTDTDTGSIDDVISAEVSDNPKEDPSDSDESLSGGIVADASSNNDNSNQNTVDDSSQDVLKASSDDEVLSADPATFDKTVYVSPTGSDTTGTGTEARPYATLQHALDQNGGYYAPDTLKIVLLDGTYSGVHSGNTYYATVSHEYDYLLICAENEGAATLDGLGRNKLLHISASNVHIRGINFVNAHPTANSSGVCLSIDSDVAHVSIENCNFTNNGNNRVWGGAIHLDNQYHYATMWNPAYYTGANDINITGCYFEDNTAEVGGCIRAETGSNNIRLRDCTFVDNHATAHGGVACLFGNNVGFENSTFINNSAPSSGAVHFHTDSSYVNNCTFIGNKAEGHGNEDEEGYAGALGLVYKTENGVSINNSKFYNNTASRDGGAVQIIGGGSNAKIFNSEFENNTATYGGAVSIIGSNTQVTNSTFNNNSANTTSNITGGGAVYIQGSGTNITGSTFANNTAAEEGGAIFVKGTNTRIVNSTLADNTAGDDGGAIFWEGNNGIVDKVNFTNNTGTSTGGNSSGGAMIVTGNNLKISNSSFTSDTVVNSPKSRGGALFITGTNTKITDSNFTDCNASCYGGAVQVIGNGTNITNCNFENNNALPDKDKIDDGLGGAVYIQGTGCHVTDSNFTHNTARNGSAIYVNPNGTGDNYIDNCVFVENQAWVYWLPILYDNETHKIETNLTGGNNILNAIYNNGSNKRLYINDTNPVLGWENSGNPYGSIPYQDDLEFNQEIVITVYDRSGNIVFNETRRTNISGTVSVDIPTDTSSWFIINMTHTEDPYYKYITNITAININPGVTVSNVTMYEGNQSPQVVVVDVVDGSLPVANATINLTVIVNGQPIEIGYGNTSDGGVFQVAENTWFKTFEPGEYKIQATCSYLYYNVTTGKNETKTVVGNGTLKVLPYEWDLTKTIIAVNGQPYTEGMEIHVNDNITFNITVSNLVDAAITSVKVTDPSTVNLTYVSYENTTGAEWTYSGSVWTLDNLPAKGNASLLVTFKVINSGTSINVANSTISESNKNKSANVSFNVLPKVELSIVKTVDVDPDTVIYVGDEITFVITVTNNGPSDAHDVNITDELNTTAFEYVDCSAPGVESDGVVTWNVGNLAAGNSTTVTVTVKVKVNGTLSNMAVVVSKETKNETNDTTDVPVLPQVSLEIIKEINTTDPVLIGEEIDFTITVINHGLSNATNVNVTDILQEGFTSNFSGEEIIPLIEPGKNYTFHVIATAAKAGTWDNTANATCTENKTLVEDTVEGIVVNRLTITISVENYTTTPGTTVPVEITVVDQRGNPVSITLTVVVTGPDATDSLPPHEGKLVFTISTDLGADGDQVTTDSEGKATYKYTVPEDATDGTSYTVTASSEETDKYAAAEGTGYIDVIQYETTTTISDATGAPGETVTLDVEVTTEDGTPFNGDVVITCPDGKKVTVTINDGKGQFDWTIPEDAKDGDEFTFTATFEGNSTYLASSGNGTVTVKDEGPEPGPEPQPEPQPEKEVPAVKMLNTGNPLVALLAAFVLIGLGLKRREEE